MKGIVRPCRHRLGPELHARWLSHLCGLCLSLRDSSGQGARVLAGYDTLLVSVLIEAQQGRLPTREAGRCVLRGFRGAQVVEPATPAMRTSTAVALTVGGAGLMDKDADGDTPRWLRPVVVRLAGRLRDDAERLCSGFDASAVSEAPARAREAEARSAPTIDELLDASGSVVAEIFRHTAQVAGAEHNADALARVGDSFGRLVHLVDASEDRVADRRNHQFNPLEATGTNERQAGEIARRLHRQLLDDLGSVQFVDGALAEVLFGPTLATTIARVWPERALESARQRAARPAFVLAAAMAVQAAIMPGRGRGRWGPYDDPYARRRYRRGGFGDASCCDMLACDCCANCACDECCGGDACFCCC